jgi:hypothetical protein
MQVALRGNNIFCHFCVTVDSRVAAYLSKKLINYLTQFIGYSVLLDFADGFPEVFYHELLLQIRYFVDLAYI